MDKPSQQLTGDYCYDLIHNEGDPGQWANPIEPAHGGATPPVRRVVGPDGDYGYDEAHDL